MCKEMWIDEMERIRAELEDEGYSEDDAYRLAEERASDAVADRLADMADMARIRTKEGA